MHWALVSFPRLGAVGSILRGAVVGRIDILQVARWPGSGVVTLDLKSQGCAPAMVALTVLLRFLRRHSSFY